MPVPMTAAPDMQPASAPIPSQLRTAVKLIMPRPAEASARKPMPTTAATVLIMMSVTDVKSGGMIANQSVSVLITITAEIAIIIMPVTGVKDFGVTAHLNVRFPIMIIAETDHLFQFRPMPIAVLFTVIAAVNALHGHVIPDIQNPATLVFSHVLPALFFIRTKAVLPISIMANHP